MSHRALMNVNTMKANFVTSFFLGLPVGVYLMSRYYPQRTWNVCQLGQTRSQSSQTGTPTDQPDKTNLAGIDGEERDATWSSTGDTIFAFGDQGKYFFAYRTQVHGTHWQAKTGTTVESIMNTGIRERLARPYSYAWTSTNDELIGYLDIITDKVAWQFRMDPSRPVTAPNYNSLLRWLNENANTPEDMLQTKVVFGSKATYFAQNGKKWIYHDLPPILQSVLQQKKYSITDPDGNPKAWLPRIVALGPDNTFVVLWDDGSKGTNFADHPSIAPLAAEIKEKAPRQYENIVLSPFNIANYFRIMKTGHAKWHMTGPDVQQLELAIPIGTYTQIRAKEDGTIFNLSSTIGEVTHELEISPDTNHSEADIRAALTKPVTAAKVGSSIVDRVKALLY